MAKTAMIRARTEPGLKAQAEKILRKLGLTCSEAINLFFAQITMRKGIPFDISIPNKATLNAMKEVEKGSVTKVKNTKELFRKR